MLKRKIKFTNFNDEEVEETHYFNLTKTELLELEVEYEGGLEATVKKIIEANDQKTLLREFKRIILMAYGKKSADGSTFEKNDEIRKQFEQTAAFDALFMELASSDTAGSAFITGLLPKDLQDEAAKEDAKKALQQATAERMTKTEDDPKGMDRPKTTAEIAAEQA